MAHPASPSAFSFPSGRRTGTSSWSPAERVSTVYHTLERPLIPVLAGMEMAGIKVDRDVLSRLSNGFAQKMAALEDEIQTLAGRKFNVGSPKQLGEILFEKLELPVIKKTPKGAPSTAEDVLAELALEFSRQWLKPGGAMVVKVFQGEGFDAFLKARDPASGIRDFGELLDLLGIARPPALGA